MYSKGKWQGRYTKVGNPGLDTSLARLSSLGRKGSKKACACVCVTVTGGIDYEVDERARQKER